MGKKGSWFSAIKRVFTHNSKEKQVNEFGSKNSKETKNRVQGLRRGETRSFLPKFREPSSIEKILQEVDEQKLFSRPSTPFELQKTPSLVTPRVASSRAVSPKATSTRVISPKAASQKPAFSGASSSRDVNRHKEVRYRPESTFQYRHLSATNIQSAYRGYMARRSFRALRGIVRLQGVVRGQNVKRQTENTMKMMQLLVRIQTQIHSQRIQMLENQSLQHQAYKFDQYEAGNQDDWDDSTLMKEEKEARMQKKMEAALKRERMMAYAYSHQSWKSNPKSAQASLPDVRPGGFPWWWNWLECKLPDKNNTPNQHYKPPINITINNYETKTPTSTRSMVPPRSKHFMPTPTHKTPACPKTKQSVASFRSEMGLKDDDSLTSCPPFSVPSYMTPTVSAKAKAKARASSTPKERLIENVSKRRFSFPLTPNSGSFKWNKGSSNKDSGTKKLEKQQSFNSGGDFSIDSVSSMPSAVGRKPFNRFV